MNPQMDLESATPSRKPHTAFTCGGCDNWWTGLNACHCSACHRTFTGIWAFDIHRAGSHAADTRHCLDPAAIRSEKGALVLTARDRPTWSSVAWGSADEELRFD